VKAFGELCKNTSANPRYFVEFTESQRKKAYTEMRMVLEGCNKTLTNIINNLASITTILTEDVEQVPPYIDSILKLPYVEPNTPTKKPDVCNRDGCTRTGYGLKVTDTINTFLTNYFSYAQDASQ
jgi:hypothetical protein